MQFHMFFLSFPNCLSVGFFFSTSDVSREVDFHHGKSSVKSMSVTFQDFSKENTTM